MIGIGARLSVIGTVAIFLATAANALFFQERRRPTVPGSNAAAAVVELQAPPRPSQVEAASPRAPAADGTTIRTSGPAALRLQSGIERELGRKGYFARPAVSIRDAIVAYEYDSGTPLTGEANEALLRRLIFDLDPAPRGALADRAETDRAFVLEMQKVLLELGYFSGALSGKMDVWTSDAIKDFERHRSIPETGRLAERTLLELIAYGGQPLRKTAR